MHSSCVIQEKRVILSCQIVRIDEIFDDYIVRDEFLGRDEELCEAGWNMAY